MASIFLVHLNGSDTYALRRTAPADTDGIASKIETEEPADCESFLLHYFESRCVDREKKTFRFGADEVANVVKVAEGFSRRFLPLQNAVEQLKHQASNNRFLPAEQRQRDLCHQIHILREEEFRVSKRRELLENELKVAIGTAAGIQGLATWRSHEQDSFNRERFKAEHPDMFRAYVQPKIVRLLKLS